MRGAFAIGLAFFFTLSEKVFAGLKDGMKCSGISIAVFLLILRAIFLARFFTMKLPNPRKYKFFQSVIDVLTTLKKVSKDSETMFLSIPVLFTISAITSALVILFEILFLKLGLQK